MQPINSPTRTNYNNVGTRNNGFQYRILPLSFNLQQKGNCSLKNNTKDINIKIGDTVSGKNISDNKKHTGVVINIKYNDNSYKPTYITILDSKNICIDLLYKTVKLLRLKESYGFDKELRTMLLL